MTSEHQFVSRQDEGDKMVVFERGDLVFVFNFHWNNSYFNYRVGCSKPGKYKVRCDFAAHICSKCFGTICFSFINLENVTFLS